MKQADKTAKPAKVLIGLTEKVTVKSMNGSRDKKAIARIDTGATKSSMDTDLAASLSLGPIIDTTLVKSASGSSVRPVIVAKIMLKGKEVESKFTLADRKHMSYKVLIGQNILKEGGFLIDPSK
ncbi:RimK/LysX family protein [Candidatus Woesearchaeota archaeon]|nr:RimK/LysX family protein [Candidatus Woesearchaeota archaeon]MBW3017258.1 RimK/LysX family protein [Candidatus Woesearchaeota archaeon]